MITLEPLKLVHALMALDWRAQQPKCLRTRGAITEIDQVTWWRDIGNGWFVVMLDGVPVGYTGTQWNRNNFPEVSFLIDLGKRSIWQEAFDLALPLAVKQIRPNAFTGDAAFVTAEVYDDAETRTEWLQAAQRYDADWCILPKRKKLETGHNEPDKWVDSTLLVFDRDKL